MSGSLPPDYLQRVIWVSLHRVHDLIVKLEGDAFSSEPGVPYQQLSVLLAVDSGGGSVTPVELSRRLDRNPNTISTILDRMERQGLTTREHSQKDRRLVYVQLTVRGREILERAMNVERELVNRVTGVLSEEELRSFNEFLERIGEQAATELGRQRHPGDTGKRRPGK